MGSFYRSQHELILRSSATAPVHTATTSNLAASAATAPTSGTIRAQIVSQSKAMAGNLLTLHPTVKPVAMVADAILDSDSTRRDCARCFHWDRARH